MKRTAKIWIIVAAVAVVVVGISGAYLLFREEKTDDQSLTESLIRLNGGVEVVFTSPDSLSDEQWNAAKAILQKRLVLQDILNAEIRVEEDRLIVRAPLAENQEIKFLQQDVIDAGRPGRMTFRVDEEEILNSGDMVSAKAVYDEDHDIHTVQITLTESGKAVFAAATTQQLNKGTISVWLDDRMVCNPTVSAPITNGVAAMYVDSASLAKEWASIINSGPMPVVLKAESGEFLIPDMVLDGD